MKPTQPMHTAHSFTLTQCDDPKCGVHLLSLDCHENVICDTTITLAAGETFIAALQALLYEKAVANDDEITF